MVRRPRFLDASRGVQSATVNIYDDGWVNYTVKFDRPVDECGWTVSMNPAIGGPPEGFGETTVGLRYSNTDPYFVPDPTELVVQLLDGNGGAVRMADPENPPEGVLRDTFTVAVHC
jgi:hypothetical protein